jgi:hypothetical protein
VDHVGGFIRIGDEDDLQQPPATSASPHEPSASAVVLGIGAPGIANHVLNLVGSDAVLGNMLDIPLISSKADHAHLN